MLTRVLLVAAIALVAMQPARAADFMAGIGTHVTSDEGLDMIHDAGVRWLRDDIHWSEVEREKNVLVMPERYERYVNEALARGIQPLLILCYGNQLYDNGGYPISEEAKDAFARFAEFVVRHFRGRVHLYEVWNEWNIGVGVPDRPRGEPESYAALLKKVYPRLKAVDGKATIIGGVIGGNGIAEHWLERAGAAGMLRNLDALSFHPYCFGETVAERLPETGFVKRIRASREVLRRLHKANLPIYITEIGWPNHTAASGSMPEDSARFLARTYLLARTLPFIRGIWWYDFRDDGTDPAEKEHHFGIVARDFTPKPAYFAMRDVCRLFQNARFIREVKGDARARILEFRKSTGATVFAAWSFGDGPAQQMIVETNKIKPGVAWLREFGRPVMEKKWELCGGKCRLRVPLSGAPWLLETGAAHLEVRCSQLDAAHLPNSR